MATKFFYFVLAIVIVIVAMMPVYMQMSYYAAYLVWGVVWSVFFSFISEEEDKQPEKSNDSGEAIASYVIVMMVAISATATFIEGSFFSIMGFSTLALAAGHLIGILIFKAKPEETKTNSKV